MRTLISAAAGLSVIAMLASCDPVQVDPQTVSGPYKPVELRTLLAFQGIDQAFGTDEKFRKSLGLLGQECKGKKNLRACIQDLLKQNDGKGSDRFNNLGGIPTHAMLDIANNSLKSNGKFNGEPKDFGVTGQIRKTCLDGSPGYAYDSAAETLELCVRTVISKNKGGKKIAIELKVKATDALYEAKKGTDPDDVFPKAAKKTGIKINSTTATGFESKLYAFGKETITVEEVWVNTKYEMKPADFERVPKPAEQSSKLKKYQGLYETYASSCIDMMFAKNIPPDKLQDMDKPPYYCLGRCKNPPIINTH